MAAPVHPQALFFSVWWASYITPPFIRRAIEYLLVRASLPSFGKETGQCIGEAEWSWRAGRGVLYMGADAEVSMLLPTCRQHRLLDARSEARACLV